MVKDQKVGQYGSLSINSEMAPESERKNGLELQTKEIAGKRQGDRSARFRTIR